jgi:Fe-Mn family superoxide dismutase
MNRRSFLSAFGAAALMVGMSATAPTVALAETLNSKGGKSMSAATFDIKPLPFDPKSIKGMSEKMLVSHHDNNYGGAVKRLNAITEQIASLDWAAAPNFTINGLKREELIAANSMILHEVYFDGLGAEGEPSGHLADALMRDFGSVEKWRAQFIAIGKALGGGSGWVLLTYSPHGKRLINTWAADHTMTLAAGRPILVLDMYEHAYQMDYGAKAADYIDTVMKNIKWGNAAALYEHYCR